MSNPIFQAMGGGQNAIMANFQRFMREMQGKNPNEEIAKLLRSGKISQAQLNQAQQMAQQMQGVLGQFRK